MNAETVSELLSPLDPAPWVVTASAGARRGGLIATFVNPVSLVPDLPRMLVALAKHHHTWELVEASGAFGLHRIGEDQLDWVWRFGLRSGRGSDKLAGLEVEAGASGAPLLKEAVGRLDCRVEARLDTGDRTVYLAEVLDARRANPRPILTVRRMWELTPADRLREMDEQFLRDSAVDARAIEAWRRGER